MGDLRDHPADLGAVVLQHRLVQPVDAERPDCGLLVFRPVDGAPDLGDLQLRCHYPAASSSPASARLTAMAVLACSTASSIARGAISFRSRPRAAAMSSGRFSPRSAAMTAFTMLMGLSDPNDFDRMSLIPAASTTARTGPPAMTPVPGAAGFSRTTPALSSATTSCGMVVPIIGTGNMAFLASSSPFWMAAVTYFA